MSYVLLYVLLIFINIICTIICIILNIKYFRTNFTMNRKKYTLILHTYKYCLHRTQKTSLNNDTLFKNVNFFLKVFQKHCKT